ncbi:Kae1-associated serine/threonine protein kinase [Candidatus Woesearchaeota archaeon]|nr:Kae1-associated serine/threonine protein kinase [Candidatus Woesearchaeota archaeon]MBW3021327.1 Kae1-associated serine/threonine protein kinase [Candidatus Woesearchaeota archaeon]
MPQIIGQGAEATIYLDDNTVTKERSPKSYRLKQIDEKLRKFRTRREAKVIQKLQDINFPGPGLINMDDKNMKIDMNFIEGKKVRDILHENHLQLSKEIGKKLALLHKHNIIHADLTTSNMILKDEIHFIDFGLSFFSDKIEDKACDLHLLRQALESKHYQIYEECFQKVLDGYQDYPDFSLVLERLEKVEKRGRNKNKT